MKRLLLLSALIGPLAMGGFLIRAGMAGHDTLPGRNVSSVEADGIRGGCSGGYKLLTCTGCNGSGAITANYGDRKSTGTGGCAANCKVGWISDCSS